MEAELLETPLPMPENALSAEDFGAIADDGEDDAMAIVQCIAQAAQCIVCENLIENSTYQGISFFNSGLVENMQIINNAITGCGTVAIGIGAEANGSAVIRDNTVTDAKEGELENLSNGDFTVLETGI